MCSVYCICARRGAREFSTDVCGGGSDLESLCCDGGAVFGGEVILYISFELVECIFIGFILYVYM